LPKTGPRSRPHRWHFVETMAVFMVVLPMRVLLYVGALTPGYPLGASPAAVEGCLPRGQYPLFDKPI
jgi:hypothetical protein